MKRKGNLMEQKSRIIIIGGGAAGLMAAGNLREKGFVPTVIEHKEKCGQKILITGKGRCNVTNQCDIEEFMQNIRRNPRFLYSSISNFTPEDTMDFFDSSGVPLKTERGKRVFPVSDRASDILNALLKNASGMNLIHGAVKQILVEDKTIIGIRLKNDKEIEADVVLLCTGGLSYKATGSTGDGYRMAEQLGHTIVPPEASLVGLTIKGKECTQMMGLSLKNVELKLLYKSKIVFAEQGEMLFTHFGISGPIVLSASAHMKMEEQYIVEIDLKPALSLEELDKRLVRDFEKFSNKDVKNVLSGLLPQKMIPIVLERWGIGDKKTHQVTKQEREKLVLLLKHFEFAIEKKESVEYAVITAGGVSVKEVNPKTMQSKLVDGLFFAGEILDVDGYTGGFNLQIAFSTAVAAVGGIQKFIAEREAL